MSLSWNIEKIKDYETVCRDAEGHIKHRTEALIFATMSVGMGRITEDNAAEFYARLHVIEGATGSMCYGPDPVPALVEKIAGDTSLDLSDTIERALREAGVGGRKDRSAPFTADEIKAHIGLTVNVGYETREEWAQRVIIGAGDRLHKYGERRLSDEEIEAQQQELRLRAEQLYNDSRYDAANDLENQIDRYDVTVMRDLVGYYERATEDMKL
jgi:IS5 family transposase